MQKTLLTNKDIKRLSTINLVGEVNVISYELPKTKKTPYIVDDSHFCPISEALKQLNHSAPISDSEIESCFDFPDGKDDGRGIPFQRQSACVGVAELAQNIMDDVHTISETVDKAKKTALKRAELTNISDGNINSKSD